MKNFMGKLLIVVIFVGILVGIYYILPEYPQNYVKSLVQTKIDKEADARIQQVKQLKNKDVENQTYETILTTNTNAGCWTYLAAEKSDDGCEHVYYYGKDADVNLKDWPDYGGLMYNGAIIKVDFAIKGGGSSVEISPYIDDISDGKALQIFDGKHVDANNKIKIDYFTQLYKGMKSDN